MTSVAIANGPKTGVPNMQTIRFKIIGTAPMVQSKFRPPESCSCCGRYIRRLYRDPCSECGQ